MPKKPTIREIAAWAVNKWELAFEADVMDGTEARENAFADGMLLAEIVGRKPHKVFARITVLFGWAKPILGCRCQLCRPPLQ